MSSLPDTGASKSLINEHFAIQCGLKILPLAPTILRQAGGSTLSVCGYTIFKATFNDVITSIRAIIVTKLHKNLLISWQDLISLKVINENFPAQIQEVHSAEQELYESSRHRIISKFQETLSDDLNPNPMEIPGKSMHIYLQPNAVPNMISIARLVPLRMQRAANQVISDLLKKQHLGAPQDFSFQNPMEHRFVLLLITPNLTNLLSDQYTHSHWLQKYTIHSRRCKVLRKT